MGLALAGVAVSAAAEVAATKTVKASPSAVGTLAPGLQEVGLQGVGLLKERAALELGTEISRLTKPLLGVPYKLSPLGEGVGAKVDPDPRVRLDAFDCTTFVETALALVWTAAEPGSDPLQSKLDELSLVLDQIRYSGQPRFDNRRHLVVAQWLPALQEEGVLTDVTAALGEGTEWLTLELTPEIWKSRRVARSLRLPTVPFGVYRLPVVPLAAAEEALRLAPVGSVVNVVRAENPRSPILVTHQALLVEKQGVRLLRHASESLGRVADQTPAQFLRIQRQTRKWPVVGLNFQQVGSCLHGGCCKGSPSGCDPRF